MFVTDCIFSFSSMKEQLKKHSQSKKTVTDAYDILMR